MRILLYILLLIVLVIAFIALSFGEIQNKGDGILLRQKRRWWPPHGPHHWGHGR
uniref:Preprotein translocase subunit SecG n=1 Tax=Meloidogyne hapla TaxID=6305 RepID=A0A1I8BV17_MELHA